MMKAVMTRNLNSPSPRFTHEQELPEPPAARFHRSRVAPALLGSVILALSGFIAGQLWLSGNPATTMLGGLALGLLIGALRWVWATWLLGALFIALICAVAFTPMVPNLIAAPEPADMLGPADAAVALGTSVNEDGSPDAAARDRILHAIEMVRLGYTHRIVLCGVLWTPQIVDMVRDLGNDCEVMQTGPVSNTHDEALAVARMARDNKWSRVILVTEAWHMPRSAAVFRSAGVNVLRSPCSESRYDFHNPTLAQDRILALRDWLHEAIGWRVYLKRGWITPGADSSPATQPQ